MEKEIKIKAILIISSFIAIFALTALLVSHSQVTFGKNFFQGILSGLVAIAIVVWLISLIKVFLSRKKIPTEGKYLFSHRPFLLSAGMVSLFTGILLQQLIKENMYILIGTICFIGLAIVLLLFYLSKTRRREIQH